MRSNHDFTKEFRSYLKTKFWHISGSAIDDVLGDFEGYVLDNPVVETPLEDKKTIEPHPQRDYTGVVFKHKNGLCFGKITHKDQLCYYADFIGKNTENKGKWTIYDVEKWFKDGTWIEVKEETPIEETYLKGNGYLVRGFHYNENNEIIITSVERLSDGEVFSIGDILVQGVKITKFIPCDKLMGFATDNNYESNLSHAKKQSPLVHTEKISVEEQLHNLEQLVYTLEKRLYSHIDDKQQLKSPCIEPTNESSKVEKLLQPLPTKRNLSIETQDDIEESRPFEIELISLINRHSKENGSNTPDFILASFMNSCLLSFDEALNERIKWHQ